MPKNVASYKNKRLTDTLILSLVKNPSVSHDLGFDHNTLRGKKHGNIKHCKTLFLDMLYAFLELSLFHNNYN